MQKDLWLKLKLEDSVCPVVVVVSMAPSVMSYAGVVLSCCGKTFQLFECCYYVDYCIACEPTVISVAVSSRQLPSRWLFIPAGLAFSDGHCIPAERHSDVIDSFMPDF